MLTSKEEADGVCGLFIDGYLLSHQGMSSDVAKSTNMSEAKDEPMEEDGAVSEDEAPEKGQADQGVRRRQPRSHGGIGM